MSGPKLIVVGGGAAGFFSAVTAARLNPSLQVTLLEKSTKLLSKVTISGGGRCNVTHACSDRDVMSKQYPRGSHFVRKAFHEFFTNDTIRWFEERGVPLKTEKDGRMFPVSNRSQSVVDCLLREAATCRVDIRLHEGVSHLHASPGKFRVTTTAGTVHEADFVCIAAGGYPKPEQFGWLSETGHTIEPPVPSLFTFNIPGHPLTSLMGVSVENARIKIAGTREEQTGPLLITHWGLSGPAVLKLSAFTARELHARAYAFSVLINWLPDHSEQSFRERLVQVKQELGAQRVIGKNKFGLPSRLWEFLATASGAGETMRWADLPGAVLNRMVKQVCSCEMQVKGKTTFKEEFVTAGGIRLKEVDPHTMMSKRCAGLYFAGEVLDVDGVTGGYNFQHAWTSGYIAGKSIAEAAK